MEERNKDHEKKPERDPKTETHQGTTTEGDRTEKQPVKETTPATSK